MSKLNNKDVTDVLDSLFMNYAIDDDVDALDIKELMKLMRQGSDMNKAVDEWFAKAKAWDKLMFEIDEINDVAAVKGLSSKITMAAKITALSMVIEERESGGYDAKK